MLKQVTDHLKVIQPESLKALIEEGKANLIDVREPAEYAAQHIPGAVLVPLSQFDPAQIPDHPDQTIILYCRGGHRSTMAAQKLLTAGYSNVMHLAGGIEAWKAEGFDILPPLKRGIH